MGQLILFVGLLLLVQSCSNAPVAVVIPAVEKDSIEQEQDTFSKTKEPIWGYRFVLIGDFDGDKKQDTLFECFMDLETSKETNKFFTNTDILEYQGGYWDRETSAFMVCTNLKIDTFTKASDLGILYAETIGDIDGNGTDEIGVVPCNADYSSVNTYTIYTYDKGWKVLYKFEVREWEFPDLPSHTPIYGYWGQTDFVDTPKNDTLNKELLKKLATYKRVNILAPKTILFEGYLYDECEQTYLSIGIIDKKHWVKYDKISQKENNKLVKSILINYDLFDEDELRAAKGEKIKICDNSYSFLQKITFK